MADQRFFPGAVALLNSLRLAGHQEPLIVVDAGLTAAQQRTLAGHAVIVPAPTPTPPAVFLAPVGPLQVQADVAVLIDADIIATRSLDGLVETARSGRITGFVDCPDNSCRFFPEWAPALGLDGLRRQPYLNAGLLAFPGAFSDRLLLPWIRAQAAIGTRNTRYGRARLDDPFYFADQDVLNALLASRFTPDELCVLPHRLAPHPPFTGVSLIDEQACRCRYPDGTEPYLLHHVLAKPWLRATRHTAYSTLLSRLLLEPDVELRLEPSELPLRLRRGRWAAADRARADTVSYVRVNGRRQLGRFGIRTRLRARRLPASA